MGPYSKAIEERFPNWKRGLVIPRAGLKDTRARLQKRVMELWLALRILPAEGFENWNEGRLYSEFFEREAEVLLKRNYPSVHAALSGGTQETLL